MVSITSEKDTPVVAVAEGLSNGFRFKMVNGVAPGLLCCCCGEAGMFGMRVFIEPFGESEPSSDEAEGKGLSKGPLLAYVFRSCMCKRHAYG